MTDLRSVFSRALLITTSTWLFGCSATDYMEPARNAYSAGDFATADQLVAELVSDNDSNVHLYQLEHGIAQLANGQPDPAIKSWLAARDRLDSLEGRGFMETMNAWLSDDTALDFEGAAFERVLLRALLAAVELVSPGRIFGDDAIAYANQVGQVQRKIIDAWQAEQDDLGGNPLVSPDASFKFVAFGSFMIALIREADPITADEARFQMKRVVEMEPDRAWLKDELARVESRKFAAPGKGVVNILGLVGRGPFRVEDEVEATQGALQLAQFIIAALSRTWPQISAKGVPIDRLAFHRDNPDSLRVLVNGEPMGSTQVVTDVEEVAKKEYDATYDYRVARGLVRRAIKVILVEGTRQTVRAARDEREEGRSTEGELLDLGIAVLGSLWQASEVADLRCWSLLPATCQALRLELDPGRYTIEVQPQRGGAPFGASSVIEVDVGRNRASYVLALAPSSTSGVAPLISRQAPEPEPAGQQ